jgi:alpha-1,3-rhamnosyl/mannosyltransferase
VVSTHPEALLVLTHRAAQMEHELQGLIASLGLSKNVRRLGHVDRGDLNWFYANAVALTFPSRFEGFGMPVLEAMGHRCAVIAARSAALPEVVGDAGVLIDPDDEAGWTAAMAGLLEDDVHRDQLASAAADRVARDFQWQASAERLRRLYARLGAQRP